VDGEPEALVRLHGASSLERLFTRLTGGEDLERRAEDFAKTFRQ
jgi:ABC-2 type transport system ATP-binding protein